MAGGAAGGSTIISANVQVIRNVIVSHQHCQIVNGQILITQDHGMLAKESLRANRLHNQILPNMTQIERSSEWRGQTIDGFSDQVAEGLRSKGHVIEWVDSEHISFLMSMEASQTDNLSESQYPLRHHVWRQRWMASRV